MNREKLIYYCKEKNCNNKVHWQTALYGKGRCYSCAKKGKRNYRYGKKYTEKNKQKHREIMLKVMKNPKIRKKIKNNHYDVSGNNNPNYKGDKALTKKLFLCKEKGCKNKITYQTWKYSSGYCRSHAQIAKNTSRLINEKRIISGYIYICYLYCHPFRGKYNKVLEHRLVMEAHLNNIPLDKWIKYGRKGNYPKGVRFLKRTEIVHHMDGNKTNNNLENLMLFLSSSKHRKFHNNLYFYIVNKYGIREIKNYYNNFKKRKL